MPVRPLILLIIACFSVITALAQGDAAYTNNPRYTPKVNEVFNRREDSLKAQFEAKRLKWPVREIYLRSFKLDAQLEVWVREEPGSLFKFFKSYKICAPSGKLGPKRKEGDKQVPEGFYYINELNPRSNYHLSLGINYPNISDRIMGDSVRPGSAIYIHGDCVSVGCIAINDEQIEEVFMMVATARANGQEFVPIHIFPARFNNVKAVEPLNRVVKENTSYLPILKTMQSVFYYFEQNRIIPPVLVNRNGGYVTEDVVIPLSVSSTREKIRFGRIKVKKFAPGEVATSVQKQPIYPGGTNAFNAFLNDVKAELTAYLDEQNKKVFLSVEFIVDRDGSVTNVSITRGGTDVINDILISRFEKMPKWTPAIRDDEETAFKMFQTVFVELPGK
jgi:murein L,D-transpeptidase YafK